MAFKIVITKVEDKVVTTREWQKKFDVTPEAERAAALGGGSVDNYGYVDNQETRQVEIKVFEQVVDDINLKTVINAVNQ